MSATEKVEKAHAKEYEKVLKVGKRTFQCANMLLMCIDDIKSVEGGAPL